MSQKIWYSEIQYVSGIFQKVVFANEEEAKSTFNQARYEQHDKVIFIQNGAEPFLLHLRNVERISEPKEFQE